MKVYIELSKKNRSSNPIGELQCLTLLTLSIRMHTFLPEPKQ